MENNRPNPENKKPGGFRFNPYWIYGALFLILMAMLFLPKNTGQSTNWKETREMILQGDVKKIVVVNDRFVEVYLTQEAVQQKRYKGVRKRQDYLGATEPNFSFEIEKGYLNNEIQDLKSTLKEKILTPMVWYFTMKPTATFSANCSNGFSSLAYSSYSTTSCSAVWVEVVAPAVVQASSTSVVPKHSFLIRTPK